MRRVLSLLCFLPLLLSCASLGWGPRTAKDPSEYESRVQKAEYNVPVELNEKTAAWIDFFQGRGRKNFARHLERSYRYIPAMQDILREHDLPSDLVYIALIESGFNAKAHSHANAVGFWQFISATGRRYNLKINRYVDERRDYVRATHAAARYLKDLYAMFGDWYLAAASYNAGEGKIMKAIKRHGTRDFWKIAEGSYIRKETKNYIPKYLAAMIIAKNPESFGFDDLVPQEPLEYEEVEINGPPMDLRVAAKLIERDKSELETLNPELRLPMTPGNRKSYALRVPAEEAERFHAELILMPPHMRMALQEHKVQSGESLKSLAKKHNMSVEYLALANGIGKKSSLKAGQLLGIPYKPPKNYWRYAGDIHYHRVREGDSLWRIARKYNVSVQKLRSWNKGKIGRYLKPGQKIAVRGKAASKSHRKTAIAKSSGTPRSGKTITYRVKAGDSLWSIANAHSVRVADIRAWNKGTLGKYLRLNQKIKIVGTGQAPKRSVQLATHSPGSGSSNTTVTESGKTYHIVQAGDTLSTIAQHYGVRTSDLRRWNQSKLKKYLKLGQRLEIRGTRSVASAPKSPAPASSQQASGDSKYRVKDGDSLWTIANRHNVSVADLKKWNDDSLGRYLKPGQKITILRTSSRPARTVTPQAPANQVATVQNQHAIFHTITSGDTLWDIARKYGVRTADIKKWNGIDQVKRLRPGDKLKIYVKKDVPQEA